MFHVFLYKLLLIKWQLLQLPELPELSTIAMNINGSSYSSKVSTQSGLLIYLRSIVAHISRFDVLHLNCKIVIFIH